MENFLFILDTVFPVFIVVAAGYFLRQAKIINENFISVSSKIVFNVALPGLIFSEIRKSSLEKAFNPQTIVYIYAATLLSMFIAWLWAARLSADPASKGAFVQGSFRGNFAIIGLALIQNLSKNDLLGKSAIVLAFVMPLYNILSIFVLLIAKSRGEKLPLKKIGREIITNPLILALIATLFIIFLRVPVPGVINKSISYLAALSIPLALLGIGAALDKDNLREVNALAWIAAGIKVVFVPLVFTYGAYLFGFRGDDFIIMFILFSSPTAIISFIMADAMGANAKLAGTIILITTVCSVVTISIGLMILKHFALI